MDSQILEDRKNPSIIIGKNVSKMSEKPYRRNNPLSFLLYFNYSATNNVTDTPDSFYFRLVNTASAYKDTPRLK